MSLKHKTLHGLVWASSAKIVNQGVSWVITIILARLLLPEDFGLMALSMVFIGIIDLVTELGFGAAIIQKPDLDDADTHSVFWLVLSFGVLGYIVLFFLAPVLAHIYQIHELQDLLEILGLVFIIGTLKVVPFSLLTKEMAFFKRAVAETLSILLGGILSIGLALMDYGVWSLVYGALARHCTLTVSVYFLSSWRPKCIFVFARIRRMLAYGFSIAGSSIFSFLASNTDSLIVGKILGEKSLGIYSMASHLAQMPVGRVMSIVNQVMFPALSQLQGNAENFKNYFLKLTRYLCLIMFPFMVGLLFVAEPLIALLLGPKWQPMVVLFQIFCGLGVLKSLIQVIPTALMAKGQAHVVFLYNLLCALLFPVAYYVGAKFGINGIGWAIAIMYPCLSVILIVSGLKSMNLTLATYLWNVFPALLGCFVMAGALISVNFKWLNNSNIEAFYLLILQSLVGFMTYFACIAILFRDVFNDISELIHLFIKGERQALI